MKDRAMRLVRDGPQSPAVRLDDRAADRQPHPGAVRLRREERVEDLVLTRRRQADPGVRHDHLHVITALRARADGDLAPPLHALRGLDAVHEEVQEDLLELDPVARHGWQVGGERGADRHAESQRLAAQEHHDVQDELIDVLVDQARCVNMGDSLGERDRQTEERPDLHRDAEQPIEQLAARVVQHQGHALPVAHERDRLDGPPRIEIRPRACSCWSRCTALGAASWLRIAATSRLRGRPSEAVACLPRYSDRSPFS